MAQQNPTVPDEFYPLQPSQFLSAGASTALTIPAIPAGQPAKGTVFVAIITAVNGTVWVRYDGLAVVVTTGGEPLFEADWVVIYGVQAIKAVRLIAIEPALAAVKYYYFRLTP